MARVRTRAAISRSWPFTGCSRPRVPIRSVSPGRQGRAWGALASAANSGQTASRSGGTPRRSAVSAATLCESAIHSADRPCVARSSRRLAGFRNAACCQLTTGVRRRRPTSWPSSVARVARSNRAQALIRRSSRPEPLGGRARRPRAPAPAPAWPPPRGRRAGSGRTLVTLALWLARTRATAGTGRAAPPPSRIDHIGDAHQAPAPAVQGRPSVSCGEGQRRRPPGSPRAARRRLAPASTASAAVRQQAQAADDVGPAEPGPAERRQTASSAGDELGGARHRGHSIGFAAANGAPISVASRSPNRAMTTPGAAAVPAPPAPPGSPRRGCAGRGRRRPGPPAPA